MGFSSCGSWALEHRLNSCGARAYLLRGMWDFPGPGIKLVSPALAGGFVTTVPQGKSQGPPFFNQIVWGLVGFFFFFWFFGGFLLLTRITSLPVLGIKTLLGI